MFLFPTHLSTDKYSLLTSTNIGWNVLAKIHYECDTGGILFHRNNALKRWPIVQEQEHEEEHVADTEKPKKHTRPYIMTEDGKQCHRG